MKGSSIRIRRTDAFVFSDLSALSRLWVLRMLVPLGGHRKFLSRHGFISDELACMLGFGHLIDPEDEEFNIPAILAELRAMHRQAEETCGDQPAQKQLPATLRHNLQQLSRPLSLSTDECAILAFAILMGSEQGLREAAEFFDNLSSHKAYQILARILALPPRNIRNALDGQGTLRRSGLLAIQHQEHGASLADMFDLFTENMADRMISEKLTLPDLLRGHVTACPAPELSASDYPHIRQTLDILRPHLRHALEAQQRGVNILIYGAPGTGKTQLARVLAQELGCTLHAIASEDENGNPTNGTHRLRALAAAQNIFGRERTLLLFDEAEDVFGNGGFNFLSMLIGATHTSDSVTGGRKAWINHAMENTPMPVIWISNVIAGINRAFMRRFDIVFELPVPPRPQRERMLAQASQGLLDDDAICRMAESPHLAPAVISTAASVVHGIAAELDGAQQASAMQHLIDNTLRAQRHPPLARANHGTLPTGIYDPGFIHGETDLNRICEGLNNTRSARLCFYGPPGTGKTACAHWLAQQLEMPLLVKRASDLLSMYVGGTEQNLADAFSEAQRENAILLIDEVDSFLLDRRNAAHSWEVTGVNEILTQMEAFDGILIVSTNLMTALDQASLRRFDLKIRFDHLRAEQAAALLQRYCTALNLPAPEQDTLQKLQTLRQLTPGDFAAVARRNRFHPLSGPAAFVQALGSECAFKEAQRAPVGFTH